MIQKLYQDEVKQSAKIVSGFGLSAVKFTSCNINQQTIPFKLSQLPLLELQKDMPYISNNIGPSPFLTASHHHFHPSDNSSNRSHYSTNSYTNVPTYLASYANPTQSYHEKYFPKDMINFLPGVTNFQSGNDQKLIHPLDTYSGNVFSTLRINSPFNRGQIYLPNKSSITSSVSHSSSTNSPYNKTADSYLQRKENPFTKKYLLTEKNTQLQNYAHFFQSQRYQFNQSIQNSPKPSKKNAQKYSTLRQPTFRKGQFVDEVLELKSKPKIFISDRQQYRKQNYGKKQSRSDKDFSDRNPFQTHILAQNYLVDEMVESEVDLKQFDSFGQGKEKQQNNVYSNVPSYRSYENSRDNLKNKAKDQGQSIIVGLSKLTSNEYQNSKNIQKSKKQLVFMNYDDEQRKSGSFVVPNAIIDEMNNTRIGSNVIRKKDNQQIFSYGKQYERQQSKYTKEEAIQVGKNPPDKIMMRGKTYEKISL